MNGLRERERYAVMVLLDAASGLRPGELLALRLNDIDFKASTISVDEALPRKGEIGPCKNAAAYRTVLLRDDEGKRAMRELKRFHKGMDNAPHTLLFRTKRGGPRNHDTETMFAYGSKGFRFPKGGYACLS